MRKEEDCKEQSKQISLPDKGKLDQVEYSCKWEKRQGQVSHESNITSRRNGMKLGRTLLSLASKLSTNLAGKGKKQNKKDNNKNKKKLIK